MNEQVQMVRQTIRKDYQSESVGMIPTGNGIALVAQGEPRFLYGLMCDAVFVGMFSGKSFGEIVDYLSYLNQSLEMPDEYLVGFMKTAHRTWDLLSSSNGDHNHAYREMMQDKNADVDVVKTVINFCVNTVKEFGVSWSDDFSAAFPGGPDDAIPMGIVASFLLIGLADGDLDAKELKALMELATQRRDHADFGSYFATVAEQLESYVADLAAQGLEDPGNLFGPLVASCEEVRNKHGEKACKTYKLMIIDLMQEVASASGGFLGFGKKVGKEEEMMISTTHQILAQV